MKEVSSDAEERLGGWRALVEAELDRLLPYPEGPRSVLYRAMRHAVAGGKRLRPLLFLAAARAAGHTEPEALAPAACAVELIHQYSLVHDDLPALDDDAERRGVPSCHVLFGEAVAILVGDALLTLAFEALASPLPGIPPDRQLAALRSVALAVGHAGMVGGQLTDLALAGRLPEPSAAEAATAARGQGGDLAVVLAGVSDLKTGALFRACAQAGGILVGADRECLAALDGFARGFGRAFQIADDLIDGGGILTVLTREEAQELGRRAAGEALAALSGFGGEAGELRALLAWLSRRF